MIVGGILGPFEDVLASLLEWLHASVGFTWAWSIVAVTVIVRTLLLPLTVKQIHSMQRLQAHMPEMKAIQAKYKGDRQRMNEEMMKFYRENKINPASSCLPIVFQLPVFLALFFVLRDFEDEILPRFPESALHWLNLVTITEPTKDGWGPLLIVIYVASQITSLLLSATTLQPMQKWLFVALPFIFIPFIINFPSGLMIYWLTTNLWTTGQGIVTRRTIPRPEPPPKRSSRTPPRRPPGGGDEDQPADRAGPAPRPAAPATPKRVKRKKQGRARR
jgi:YidC/Oxa1 family membrane protein insertase